MLDAPYYLFLGARELGRCARESGRKVACRLAPKKLHVPLRFRTPALRLGFEVTVLLPLTTARVLSSPVAVIADPMIFRGHQVISSSAVVLHF